MAGSGNIGILPPAHIEEHRDRQNEKIPSWCRDRAPQVELLISYGGRCIRDGDGVVAAAAGNHMLASMATTNLST